jgi:hypothetical protein
MPGGWISWPGEGKKAPGVFWTDPRRDGRNIEFINYRATTPGRVSARGRIT